MKTEMGLNIDGVAEQSDKAIEFDVDIFVPEEVNRLMANPDASNAAKNLENEFTNLGYNPYQPQSEEILDDYDENLGDVSTRISTGYLVPPDYIDGTVFAILFENAMGIDKDVQMILNRGQIRMEGKSPDS